MADDDRYRDDRHRYRDRDDDGRGRGRGGFGGRGLDHGDDGGMIARRGFGNASAGYDRGRDAGRSGFERGGSFRGGSDERRERDFGDSAGYGSGGSTRDWRDVMGEDRGRGGMGYDRSGERGFGSGQREDLGRYGSSDFGRGSRGDQDERGFFERMGDEVRSWLGNEDRGAGERPHHRGRGPKNYTRSDDRIRDDVSDRLTDDPHVDASEIEVNVQNREVTLSGTVNSRFEKRHAEDLAESVSGVAHVQNNLRVQMSTQQPVGFAGTEFHGTGSTGSQGAPIGGATGTGLGGGETSGADPAGGSGRRRGSSGS